MILYPNAKLNIGLSITEKRADGFHNLESCFIPINWQDILEIVPSKTKTEFSFSGIAIPGKKEDNICLKAFHLLQKDFDINPVKIHLHKQIPIGAGLGGGSSNGSFTLKGLNELFQLQLSNENLENYARQLGSDCAFFIKNQPVIASEKGDVLHPISIDLSAYYIYLAYPHLHISTAEAYAGVSPKKTEKNLADLLQAPISEWKNNVHNDFEHSIFPKHPEIKDIKEKFYQHGALYASMSGSGSTVYGIFSSPPTFQFSNCTTKILQPILK